MTPEIITTLVIIVAMFALMLLNKFPLAVTMTLTGVALWLTGIVEPAKLYSNFGGSTIIQKQTAALPSNEDQQMFPVVTFPFDHILSSSCCNAKSN